ncbi:MAG TPA: GNAT family N-acetyltransferase [Frankiaceae bacterium]|jgi:ribosomal protein S18 acetylase RimI-like enzyme|nr:GNAT family N-acetyltransferase [Frankiaceae bacterium]
MEVRVVDPEETVDLRQRVLRPHWTTDQMRAASDPVPSIAVYEDGTVVATANVRPEPMPGDPREGDWRLRGMASDPAVRGRGYGAAALRAALDHVREHGGRRVWCNARTGAMGFYERHGFTVVGEEFDLPDAGPHYMAYVNLTGAAGTGGA